MKELNCIIIDDDEIDRLSIISHVKKYRQFIIKGVYENANEIAPTDLNDIQVAFLDIDMPEISGLEFRKNIIIYQFAYLLRHILNMPQRVLN